MNKGAVWMCCTIQAIFLLCVICVLTMMVVCDDIRAHDCLEKLLLLITCLHPDYYK